MKKFLLTAALAAATTFSLSAQKQGDFTAGGMMESREDQIRPR